MRPLGPRALSPHDGGQWLKQAALLLLKRPGLFLSTALLGPVGSLALLSLPVWDLGVFSQGMLAVIPTIVSYGFPLTIVVVFSCAFARAANKERPPRLTRILQPAALKLVLRTSGILFFLVLQGYLAVYLIHDLISPATILAGMGDSPPVRTDFALADTILGTLLGFVGGILLVMQLLFATFIIPLLLFRELPLYACWRLSYLAMQLNPWLWPTLGLLGIVLVYISSISLLSIPAQILVLPLSAYLGVLLYVAWMDIFQGGSQEELTQVNTEAIA